MSRAWPPTSQSIPFRVRAIAPYQPTVPWRIWFSWWPRGKSRQRSAATPKQAIPARFRRVAARTTYSGTRTWMIIAFQPHGGLADHVEQLLKDNLLRGKGHIDLGQISQVGGRPTGLAAVTQVVPQQIHLELLPGPVLLRAHLEPGADQIPHRLIHRFGHVNAR